MTFAKSQRLVTQTEIQRAFRTKFKAHHTTCSLYLSKVSTESNAKYQIVVPKKVLKRAHDRNRMKRRIFGVLQQSQDYLSEINFNVIIIIRSSQVMLLSASELQSTVLQLIKQAEPQSRFTKGPKSSLMNIPMPR